MGCSSSVQTRTVADPTPAENLGNPFSDQPFQQFNNQEPVNNSLNITVGQSHFAAEHPPPQQPAPQTIVQEQVYVAPAKQEEPVVEEELGLGEIDRGVTYWVGKTSNKIKSINVAAGECKNDIAGIEAKIKQDNSQLKMIRVGFDPSETGGVDHFLSGIFATANYNNVQICFENIAPFSKTAFVECGKALAKLQLEKFFIENWGSDFHDGVFADIKSGLQSQKNLKNVDLFIYEGNITDNGLKSLCEIYQGANNLEEISLIIERGEGITDASLTLLKQALSRKPKITKIELALSGMSKLTQTGLNEIRDLLQSNPTLKTVDIAFARGGATPEALEALRQALLPLNIPTCNIK